MRLQLTEQNVLSETLGCLAAKILELLPHERLIVDQPSGLKYPDSRFGAPHFLLHLG